MAMIMRIGKYEPMVLGGAVLSPGGYVSCESSWLLFCPMSSRMSSRVLLSEPE
jgi:hypothetical protein